MVDSVNAVLQLDVVKYPLFWGMLMVNVLLVGAEALLLVEGVLNRVCMYQKKFGMKGIDNE